MANIPVSQAAIESMESASPDARLSQEGLEVGRFATDEVVRISQFGIELILFANFMGQEENLTFTEDLQITFTGGSPSVCIPIEPPTITPALRFLTEPLETIPS